MCCSGEIWQEDVKSEKLCVCECVEVGRRTGGTGRSGGRNRILDLRTTAAQGQEGNRPYLGVGSSQAVISQSVIMD